jgi:hypothetical protein
MGVCFSCVNSLNRIQWFDANDSEQRGIPGLQCSIRNYTTPPGETADEPSRIPELRRKYLADCANEESNIDHLRVYVAGLIQQKTASCSALSHGYNPITLML